MHAIEEIVARSGRRGPVLTVTGLLDTLDTRSGFADAVAHLRDLVPPTER